MDLKELYRLAVDTGGTFTDVCALDETTGEFTVAKVPSTPDNPALAVLTGIKRIIADSGADVDQIRFLIHGTTVATNALLEGKGSPTALLTTEGFEDILQIGRQNRPKLYDFWARRPHPIVPRSRCYGVPERVLYDGEVLKNLDSERTVAFVQEIKAQSVTSIAVSLLHSYANPVHERQIKSFIEELYPEAYVTLSAEVLPEFREYERTSTICINAYVMPKVNDYVGYLDERLKNLGIASGLYIMQSNGGVITAETARQVSARTVLSGPAGGALTGVFLANTTDWADVITVDIGGTSTDICLVDSGKPRLTTESDIEGYPIKLPMIDINTIGAGGGSIAWIDAGGALQVGPTSAGAVPGPVCYGLGGEEPTVTDANAILGRINPKFLLGGEMDVHLEEAKRVVAEKIAKPLGLDLLQAAEGIIAVVNANMIRGIRRVSVERGYDPREFALVPFGGAGPLHGVELAQSLNMRRIIVPPHPGIASAFGMLSADVRHDFVQTYISKVAEADVNKIEGMYCDMETEASRQLALEGFSEDKMVLLRQADMRYLHQAYELTLDLKNAGITRKTMNALIQQFHESHEQAYGYARSQEPVEFVNLRLVALGKLPDFRIQETPVRETRAPAPVRRRQVYFGGRAHDTAIFSRTELLSGQVVDGPAIIEQLDSTTVITPGYQARIDPHDNLNIFMKETA